MIQVHQALYGNREGAHDLLMASLPAARLPAKLRGLTDRPAGTIPPGVTWEPAFGCAPAGEWWVLWCAWEDASAPRPGMARTRVAILPATDAARMPSLSALLQLVAQRGNNAAEAIEIDVDAVTEPTTSPALPFGVAKTLTSGRKPVVVPDHSVLPRVLEALWARLWPSARRSLSARVVLGPETIGGADEWWIVACPPAVAGRWALEERADLRESAPVQPDGAAGLLIGDANTLQATIRQIGGDLPADPACLRRVERIAPIVGDVGSMASTQQVVAAIREVVQLAPVPTAGAALKRRLIDELRSHMPSAPADIVTALTNLQLTAVPGGQEALASAVRQWVGSLLPELPGPVASKVLGRATSVEYEAWWREAAADAIQTGLASHDARWAKAVWRWWSSEDCAARFTDTFLPQERKMEDALLRAFPHRLDASFPIRRVLDLASQRRWSRLHAAVAAVTLPPGEALRSQVQLPDGPGEGLAMLAKRIPDAEIVEAALILDHPTVVDLAVRAIRDKPALLANLDLATASWRRLWDLALDGGLQPWVGVAHPAAAFHRLLDVALDAAECADSIVGRVAKASGQFAFTFERRPKIWSALSEGTRRVLLDATAAAWWEHFSRGESVSALEEPLDRAVRALAHTHFATRIDAALLTRFLRQFPNVGEDAAISWLSSLIRPVPATAGTDLGMLFLERRWTDAAQKVVQIKRRWETDLDSLLTACRDLLPWYERLRYWKAGLTRDEAIRLVAQAGAELVPDGPYTVWMGAAGDPSLLRAQGNGAQQWREATQLAAAGALEGGLVALVLELRERFRHNEQVKQLRELLRQELR